MLAEGILTRLIYKESCHQDKPRKSHASRKDKEGSWRQKLVDNPKIKGFADGREEQDEISARSIKMEHESGPQRRSMKEVPAKDHPMLIKGIVSSALHIPNREQNTEQMDLYRSYSCNSIYQNYPDLHIGGDHVGDHTCDSGCVLDHVCELADGPVLLSIDVPLGQSPLCEHPKNPSIKFLAGDEAGEGSIMLCEEPLSNSVLNKYMETKVAELYKQFFEENLARCGSVTNLLTCSWIRNNLDQISYQISQEQNIGTSKAREVLLHSLALFSSHHSASRNSSEFSTPNLQISNPACVRKSCRMQFTS
ncbi:TLR adapter interacting with SLC15A4 on the lysosome-like [Aegotheles albertisi]